MVQPAGRTITALLHARDVFTRAGIHFDDFADLYEQRNFNHSASRQGSRFAASTCGITFQARIGINDFQFNEVRRSNGDRLTIPQSYDTLCLIQQPFSVIANCFCISRQLLEVSLFMKCQNSPSLYR